MNALQTSQGPQPTWPPPTQPRYPVMQPPPSFDLGITIELGNQRGVPYLVVLDELRKHYVLPSDSSVSAFLSQHREISSILLDAIPQLKKYFGTSAIFSLRAPIDEAGTRSLYAVVIWPGKVGDVRNALDRFDEDWWLTHSHLASEYLVFTYELV